MIQEAPKKKKLTLCVFIDGFGWELLRSQPFLNDLLVTKSPVDTVFGYSATCIPTILTGRMPHEHGHLSFFYYQPEKSPFKNLSMLRMLPSKITDRGRVRSVLSKVLKRCYGYTGYFQIYNVPFEYLHLFDYSEKKDIYLPGGINGGVPTIFDFLRSRAIPFHVSDWRAKEETNIESLKRELAQGEISFAYLYLAAMDALLHSQGTQSPLVAQKVAWYQRQIEDVFAMASRKYEKVSLYIFSDHGMCDIHETCNLAARVDAAGVRFGVDYAAVYDSTMARFWFLKPGIREKVETALRGEVRGRLLNTQDLKQFGVDFQDHRYGELFFLMNPGILICPSFMGLRPIAGMHGYDPHDKDSLAIFASNQVPEKIPARLDELYGLMAREAETS